jgi:hypothetical protein
MPASFFGDRPTFSTLLLKDNRTNLSRMLPAKGPPWGRSCKMRGYYLLFFVFWKEF